jgi:hypothetical protein
MNLHIYVYLTSFNASKNFSTDIPDFLIISNKYFYDYLWEYKSTFNLCFEHVLKLLICLCISMYSIFREILLILILTLTCFLHQLHWTLHRINESTYQQKYWKGSLQNLLHHRSKIIQSFPSHLVTSRLQLPLFLI